MSQKETTNSSQEKFINWAEKGNAPSQKGIFRVATLPARLFHRRA